MLVWWELTLGSGTTHWAINAITLSQLNSDAMKRLDPLSWFLSRSPWVVRGSTVSHKPALALITTVSSVSAISSVSMVSGANIDNSAKGVL